MNHSGMETHAYLSVLKIDFTLRKNHSGMETLLHT